MMMSGSGTGSWAPGGVWALSSASACALESVRWQMTFVSCVIVWWALRPREAEEKERACI